MDPLSGRAAADALWQARLMEARAADAAPWAPAISTETDEAPFAAALQAANPVGGADPATDKERMLHLISHVNAECFISLLQITDPLPDDWQARKEYKRFYRDLRDTLTVPILKESE